MSFNRFKKIKTDDRVTNQLQDNIEEAFRPIAAKPSLDRYVLYNVSLKAGQLNRVAHMLGRALAGWVVCRKDAFADIRDTQDQNNSPKLYLDLWCSADVTVDIEVF